MQASSAWCAPPILRPGVAGTGTISSVTTNHERAFAERPEVYAAWAQLIGAIKPPHPELYASSPVGMRPGEGLSLNRLR